MALNIEDDEVERLAADIAQITGETKTEAVRRALAERRDRLRYGSPAGYRRPRGLRFLEREVWPHVPADQLGRRLTRDEEEEVLGCGPSGE
jgi:antitoxin VapB